ncbi:MAG: LamG-like jellyroll fold domain-containing protein [Chloroflexota bacterium]
MASDKKFKFTIIPEPTAHEIYPGTQKAICFTVANLSNRPVTIRPTLVDLQGPRAGDREPLAERQWRNWLALTESEELRLEANAVQQFKVDITPSSSRAGAYKFRLGLLGVEDTDYLLDVSDEVSFSVSEKAVSYNFRRYAIVALILLGIAVLSIAGGLVLTTPTPDLQVRLAAPETISQDKTLTYTLSVTNTDKLPAHEIVLRYKLPDGVMAAVARVEDAPYRQCDAMNQREILCGLGSLNLEQDVQVTIVAIPKPNTALIEHREAFEVTARFHDASTLAARLNIADEPVSFELQFAAAEETEIVATDVTEVLFAHSLPTVGTVAVGEPFSYRLFAWHRSELNGELWATYKLPQGLRYASDWPLDDTPLEAGNCRPLATDYFTLECNMGEHPAIDETENGQPAEVSFRVIPTQPPQEVGGQIVSDMTVALRSTNDVTEAVTEAVAAGTATAEGETSVTTLGPVHLREEIHVVDSALFFDGEDDWVELNYRGLPQSFSIDMWVAPFSVHNNQALVGAHLPRSADYQEGENLFLVGYYNDGLDVRLGTGSEDNYTLTVDKKRERFHLAIEVEHISANESHVYVYLDGKIQTTWSETGDKEERCNHQCKVFNSSMPASSETLNWILGQDWDRGTKRHASDFFHGTISDFRIWSGEQENVFALKDSHVFAPNSVEASNLEKYWRLAPVSSSAQVAAGLQVSDAQNGYDFTTFLDGKPFVLTDPQKPEYVAALYGESGWGESGARYGHAVAFDGDGDSLVSRFKLPITSIPPSAGSASGGTVRVNLSLSTWIFVDDVPTEDQWIVGYAPLAEAPEGVTNVATEIQADLKQIENEIAVINDRIQQATSKREAAQTAVMTDTAALNRAHASLLDRLLTTLNFDARQIIDGNGAVVVLYSQQVPTSTARPVFLPHPFGSPHRFPDSFMGNAAAFDADFDARTDTLVQLQKNVVDTATSGLETLKATGGATEAEIARVQETVDAARATLNQLVDDIDKARAARNAAILSQDEFEQLVAQLPVDPSLSETQQAENSLKLIRANTAVHEANVAYIRTLLPLLNLSDDRPINRFLDTLPSDPVYQTLREVGAPSSNRLNELRTWSHRLSDGERAALTEQLETLEEAKLQQNQSALGLEATQENQENNLFALRDASTRQIVLTHILDRDRARRARLNNLFEQRRQALEDVDTSDNPAAAQDAVTAVSHELTQERESNLAELKLQLASTQAQEETLNDLSPVLQEAIAEAYDAGRAAIEQQVLADIVDKILATFLAIEPCDIPARSMQEVAFDAAKLAVELSVLNDTAGRVKTAEVHLADVTQKQQCRQTQIGDARESLKDDFIQLLENYLRSINADVVKAQEALQVAQDAQNKEQQAEQEPVALPNDLLNLLAEAIANEVSIDLNNYLCSNAFEFDQLVCDKQQDAQRQELFESSDGPRPIPLIGPAISLLTVAGGPTEIEDINVHLSGSHTDVGDLTFTLVGPDGTSVTLMAGVCDSSDDFNIIFDEPNDDEPNEQKPPCPPTDGQRYPADQSLAAFAGTDSNGEWTLLINDLRIPDDGMLESWSLELGGSPASFEPADEEGAPDFTQVFDNLKRFQSGETQVALNERRQKVGTKLNEAFNTVRYRTRWQLRVHIGLVHEQLQRELQEGIANGLERQAKQLLQLVLVDMDTTLRVLLSETDFNVQARRALEPDIETAVQELERRERYIQLLDDLKSLSRLAKAQLDVISRADDLAEAPMVAPTSLVRASQSPVAMMAAESEMEARTSLAATLDRLTAVQRKVVFLGKRAFPAFFQDPEPTPEAPEVDEGAEGAAAEEPTATAPAAAETEATTPETPTAQQTQDVWLALIIDSDGHVTLAAKPDGSETWSFYKENVPVPTGEWLHYVGTVSYTVTDDAPENLEMKLYRNGELSKQADSEQFPTNVRFDQACNGEFESGFYFGSICGDFFYEGQIDDVRLWQRELDKAEARQWQRRPGEVFDEFVYWSFDQGPGTHACPTAADGSARALRNVACDTSSQGKHDLLVVGPKWTDAHLHRLRRSEQLAN